MCSHLRTYFLFTPIQNNLNQLSKSKRLWDRKGSFSILVITSITMTSHATLDAIAVIIHTLLSTKIPSSRRRRDTPTRSGLGTGEIGTRRFLQKVQSNSSAMDSRNSKSSLEHWIAKPWVTHCYMHWPHNSDLLSLLKWHSHILGRCAPHEVSSWLDCSLSLLWPR